MITLLTLLDAATANATNNSSVGTLNATHTPLTAAGATQAEVAQEVACGCGSAGMRWET